jgi:thymidylate synthase
MKSVNYESVDQLEYCINEIITNPTSRRILMTTFNPIDVRKSVLYPCHGVVSQFYVRREESTNYVDLMMFQRSCDNFLGNPYNITSYSLLCYIICDVCNYRTNSKKYKPGKLKVVLGDCHVYAIHLDACITQLYRTPYEFPKCEIVKSFSKPEDYTVDCFKLIDYKCHERIFGKLC